MSTSHAGSSCQIHYLDRHFETQTGARLLDAILSAGIDHRHICGGFGFCTSCRVEVLGSSDGLSPVSALERQRLGGEAGRLRLACQSYVYGDVTVQPARAISNRFSPDGD